MLLAGLAALVGNALFSPDEDTKRAIKRDAPPGYVRFHDRSTGISIAHPRTWIRLNPPSGQVRLLAAKAGASVQVRIAALGIEIDKSSLGPAREITDKLVSEANPIKLVRTPEALTVGGLPGYLYLYTFRDRQTGQRGVHAHYFLFRRKTLITLVFQALPAAAFGDLTRTFDKISETFRIERTRRRPADV